MAKKSEEVLDQNEEKDSKKKNKKEKKEKKKKNRLMPVILLLVVAGVVYAGRDTIAIYTQNIPVLNTIFPLPMTEEGPYENMQPDQLVEELTAMTIALEQVKTDLDTKEEQIIDLNAQIAFLQEYEKNYTEFQQQKEEWDTSLVQENPDLFMTQFETMNPELAAQIYAEIKATDELHKEYNEYVTMISEMDESAAAEILEQLLITDTALVQQIFSYMETETQSMILSQMDVDVATQIIKLISPDTQ